MDRLGEGSRRAQLAGQVGQRLVVAREAWPAICHRALQVSASDPGVQAQCSGDRVHVASGQLLAERGDHVGERDPHRHVGVDRDLGQLGVDDVHASDLRGVVAHRQVGGRELLARPLVVLADEEELGVEKVLDHLAEGDKLRAVAHPEVHIAALARLALEDGDHPVLGRSGQHGARKDDEVVALLRLQATPDRARRLDDVVDGETALGGARRGDHD